MFNVFVTLTDVPISVPSAYSYDVSAEGVLTLYNNRGRVICAFKSWLYFFDTEALPDA